MSKHRVLCVAGIVLLAFAALPRPASALAPIITVNSAADTTADDGVCTLREAIIAANTNTASGGTPGECAAGVAGLDTIHFAIPGGGVHTIQPTSALPPVTEPVIIDGYSQGVATRNTLAVGNNAVLLIEIDGTNAGLLSGGLLEISAGGSTVSGLVINRAQGGNSAGLKVSADGNIVSGNFIGTDPTGTIFRSNGCQGVGVASSGNTIGGLSPGDRNLISATGGCGGNLTISGSNNLIENNYLGTDASGTSSLFGTSGVVMGSGASGNLVGGTTAAARNVISGNSGDGVTIFDSSTTGNIVEGNFIGVDASGTLPLPNGRNGVEFSSGTHDNTVGGTGAGDGNTIAFNLIDGVALFGAPFPAGTGNAILGNSIFSNGGLGIDLASDGVTANDACDADTGPNNLQNFPVITSVTPGVGTTNIQGTLNSVASTSFRIEFFSSVSCNAPTPNDFGEGSVFLGFTTVSTDGTCNAAFNVDFPVDTSGLVVTATATRLESMVVRPRGVRPLGVPQVTTDTSEFSQCFQVAGPTPTPTNTFTRTPTSTPTNTPAGVPTNTPSNTPVGVATNTPTNTPTTTPTPSFTPVGGGFTPTPPAAIVPTLSPSMLGLLGLALVAAALLLMRRP